MRLIDADALKNLPFERMIHTDFGETAIPIDEIDNAPTVHGIVGFVERPKGKWVKSKDGYTRCDQCGSRGSAIKSRFCHHCGADMRKEKTNEAESL